MSDKDFTVALPRCAECGKALDRAWSWGVINNPFCDSLCKDAHQVAKALAGGEPCKT